MNPRVPSFARPRWFLAFIALAALPAPARADGPSGIQPWRLEVGAGYTKDTSGGAPEGSIGGQIGLHHGFWDSRLSIGIVAGYYALGSVTTNDPVTGDAWSSDYAVIPGWGQLTWDATRVGTNGWLQLSGGAGAYNKRLSGDDDCNCTDFGFNFGLGYRSADPGKRRNFGAEIRYHHLPREDNSGNKYLSVMAKLAWDFGEPGEGRF
jgi:hypothetical protein